MEVMVGHYEPARIDLQSLFRRDCKNLNENVAKKLGVSLILAYFTIGATLIKAVLWLAIRITDGI